MVDYDGKLDRFLRAMLDGKAFRSGWATPAQATGVSPRPWALCSVHVAGIERSGMQLVMC